MTRRSLGRDALRYAGVGVLNTIIGFSVIVGLERWAGLNPFLANAGGYAVGICVSFVLSRLLVFGAARSWRGAAPRYVAAVAVAFGLNQGVLWLARTVLAGLAFGPILAQGCAVVSYTAALFLLSRYWVFAAAPEAPED